MKTTFEEILVKMNDLYTKKNSDYGNSFDDTCDKFGLTAALIRMYDKLNRLSTIIGKAYTTEVDESFKDTLLDLANYAVLTLLYYNNKYELTVGTNEKDIQQHNPI